jgi:hypothetical protein
MVIFVQVKWDGILTSQNLNFHESMTDSFSSKLLLRSLTHQKASGGDTRHANLWNWHY